MPSCDEVAAVAPGTLPNIPRIASERMVRCAESGTTARRSTRMSSSCSAANTEIDAVHVVVPGPRQEDLPRRAGGGAGELQADQGAARAQLGARTDGPAPLLP